MRHVLAAGAKRVLPNVEPSQLRKFQGSTASLASSVGSSARPRVPPPPTPTATGAAVAPASAPAPAPAATRLTLNGRSTESLSSAPSDGESVDKPLAHLRGLFF